MASDGHKYWHRKATIHGKGLNQINSERQTNLHITAIMILYCQKKKNSCKFKKILTISFHLWLKALHHYIPTMLMPRVLPGSLYNSTNLGGPHVWFPDPTTTVSFCLGEACGVRDDFCGDDKGDEGALPSDVLLRLFKGLKVDLQI